MVCGGGCHSAQQDTAKQEQVRRDKDRCLLLGEPRQSEGLVEMGD